MTFMQPGIRGTRFRIDILDSSGDRLGDGPLTTVLSLSDTRSLDKIGECSFRLPAGDERTQHIAAGVQFDIYDAVDNYLGRYLYRSKVVSGRASDAIMTVDCWDVLRELTWDTVAFHRTYSTVNIEIIVDALLALGDGWTSDVDAGVGAATIVYQGENVLRAINQLRELTGLHYRLSGTKTVDFGAFGNDSGVRLVNPRGQVQDDIRTRTEIGLINSIRITDESDSIWNRVIPLGSGEGTAQQTIEGTVGGDYATETGVNPDASNYYYIEDDTSIDDYGLRVKVIIFNNIVPISNSETGKEDAADALKEAAETWMKRHLEPRVEYAVSVQGLREDVEVGDKVRITYKGATDNFVYINVDALFWVMDITRTRTADGGRNAMLTIVNVDERRKTDNDLISEVVNNAMDLQTHIGPVPFWSESTSELIMEYGIQPPAYILGRAVNADFMLEVDDSVLYITKVRIRFKTRPLNTITYWSAVAGGVLYYQLTTDNDYPTDIHLLINGIDRSVALGGPWGAGNAAVDITADITDYITGAAGGMYQDHSLVFQSHTGRPGVSDVIGYISGAVNLETSHGFISCNIRTQGVCQGIVP